MAAVQSTADNFVQPIKIFFIMGEKTYIFVYCDVRRYRERAAG
jgi:hypothetical protein